MKMRTYTRRKTEIQLRMRNVMAVPTRDAPLYSLRSRSAIVRLRGGDQARPSRDGGLCPQLSGKGGIAFLSSQHEGQEQFQRKGSRRGAAGVLTMWAAP